MRILSPQTYDSISGGASGITVMHSPPFSQVRGDDLFSGPVAFVYVAADLSSSPSGYLFFWENVSFFMMCQMC